MGSGKDIDENDTLEAATTVAADSDGLDSDGEFEATIVMSDDDDDLAVEMTAEVNVDELVAKFEAADSDDLERKRAIRQRLEKLAEERDIDLESTYNFNWGDD